ncbi:hypothetical protein [Actinoalloteichus hymeniacidonis]|uniref:MFS transporter n=1 Tax=Actinoalloteichus hymeniacidonis TaxID=340345 RepID=A0AAC9MV63_9PSEU|nr:hypothetical protein [Actinoalloteichus hymeniacidonis]AOS60898.1 hypothetical protein TL08_00245 [Actinoalloteichus hymeniacidonis]MBB5911102.1 multisubunit Na+/H+ antiporter MnhB subunit [Actinoalloteichus hymeniacidonis]
MTDAPYRARGVPSALCGTLSALLASSLSVSAHAVAGGAAPDLGLTLILTTALATILVGAPRRRRGLPTALGTLALSQLGMHALLELLSTHSHQASTVAYITFNPLVMVASHAVATLVGALLLTHADHVLRRGLGMVHRGVERLRGLLAGTARPVADGVPCLVPLTAGPSRRFRIQAGRVNTRRGPPRTP